MGIRNLNHYLRTNCPDSIRCVNASELSGKRIAVDISIYLYKYEADNSLLENMYTMLTIFEYYNIIPIFIFDGKPPPEKKALLIKRRENRQEAQNEFNKLKEQLKNLEQTNMQDDDKHEMTDKQDIIDAMDQLKKQIVQITQEKIQSVKALIRAFGATYYDAPGEADELCALLVSKKKVWACLSEDMDLFVYGCTRVLRYFSLIGHTVVLYYFKGILDELKITQQEFKEICILSGTDYNINNSGQHYTNNLKQTMGHFKKYKDSKLTDKSFYNWIVLNVEGYITNMDLLVKINKMFDLNVEHESIQHFKNVKIANGPVLQDEIEKIMIPENFIFVKSNKLN